MTGVGKYGLTRVIVVLHPSAPDGLIDLYEAIGPSSHQLRCQICLKKVDTLSIDAPGSTSAVSAPKECDEQLQSLTTTC